MLKLLFFIKILCVVIIIRLDICALLFPQYTESRQIQELDGIWNFKVDFSINRQQGFDEQWYKTRFIETDSVFRIPTCSSFNDIFTDKNLRNYVGWVWYEKDFYVDDSWKNKCSILRIESVHYNSIVWLNGKLLTHHSGGHLPFESCANSFLFYDKANWLTIAINNTLTINTLPTGYIEFPKDKESYPAGYFTQKVNFDFFNYAGIHRKVRLYTTPLRHINDINIITKINKLHEEAIIDYKIDVGDCIDEMDSDKRKLLKRENLKKFVEVVDKQGKTVSTSMGLRNQIIIKNPNLWWPFSLSSKNFGYVYTLKITYDKDVYRQIFGIREVSLDETTIYINKKKFYCHGVAKHEDSDIKGKGLDLPLIIRDIEMLKWLGSDCIRTSHYPYSEEFLEECDRAGIAVIGEAPAVGLVKIENFSNVTLTHHLKVMQEMISRDKNHPSIFMWSIANEPASNLPISDYYFKTLTEYTRSIDNTRLISIALSQNYQSDLAGKYLDILCINRYYGWYSDTGHIETIKYKLTSDLISWFKKHHKPIIVTEYGADTVAGMHSIPSTIFTEEFQMEYLEEHHCIFDQLKKTFLTGEMVWNFSDFMTSESLDRVVGNKKGLLTRQRQPKMSAHLIHKRYWKLINETAS